ncbi:carbohydrate ABC transporter permease [Vallitalea guaymasensis]|uniref:Carbohydrate ABC transporter permease n=2 Tax=Vallitalea guaymasensis TaxID=1185412 RepID=A0A8J8MBL9_9FIRM|nr:carbohydrate ABC transporter permease [Vallitalea guaymasensis]QUH29788.1 carbohydrate ABC transporter permease [Vallitalea guaymasensis]
MIKVKKKVNGSSVFDVFNIVFMILLCVVTVYPFLNQLALSLNTGSNASFGGVTIFPREFTMDNFKTLITNPSIKDAIIVSVTRVIAGTAIGLVVTTSAAYAMTCRKLPGKSVFIWFLLLPMFINAGIIPNFILFRKLHLINNFLVYIIPGSFVFYNMIIIRTFMQGIPKSLEESAYLDGANEIQILFKVILPLCKPVMATICLWVAVGHWNDWMSNLLYITKNHLNTLQYILLKVVKESEMTQSISETAALTGKAVAKPTPETVRAATIVLTTLPIIMLYPFLQKYFVKGVTIGAIKE